MIFVLLNMKKIAFILYFSLSFLALMAQIDSLDISVGENDTTDLSNLSIEELSKLKSRYKTTEMEKMVTQAIIAASRKPLSLKRSPSIVSVITADDIEKSGARDIMDVFRLIPGVDFNADVQGVVGISFRGLWANEGKVLLLLDGQEMNEIVYSTLMFGNNYNISQIKKIEVIRGPGSAIYGGFAEYAVISIMTKSAEEINGLNANIIVGQAINTYARQNMSLSVGKKINDLSLSLSTFFGRGQRSNSIYTDIYGKSFDMKNNADLNPTNLNLGVAYKGLSARFMYDMLGATTRDGYIKAMSKAYANNFTSYFAEIKYVQKVRENLQIQGRVNYKRTLPWEFKGVSDSVDGYPTYQVVADRYRVNAAAIWDAKYWLNITAGGELYYDDAQKPALNGVVFVFRNADTNRVQYVNYAGFVQSLIKSRFANLTLGARYDCNITGAAFSPRLGITKRVGRFNYKFLYGASFRAPGIENIQLSIDKPIMPEKTRTFELETGFQMDRNMYLTLSLYDIATQDAIRYVVDTMLSTTEAPEGYVNSPSLVGTRGVEMEYKYKSDLGYINLAYAYYTVTNGQTDIANAVNIDKHANLGIANHKLTLFTSANLGKYFYVSPSAIFLGKRYGYTSLDSLGNAVLSTYKPQLQLNLYIGCVNLARGLSFGMGVYNITNKAITYIQPYKGLHGDYPGMGTEIIFKLKYDIPF